ncbi:hypothetical protein QBC32DRAFT_396647 [Pseudoneurospora amorphoporcata]|uniref:Uncharacterized protein n=1 Tax=Pseudoneurospora amorphoporcata TaxID=241081 RepID=A0AAN6P1I6_9PEZI|nr:hypothetical protein QBC32DRAFT_396647 [Pseudoneurospora amorphoporcata]
MARPSHEASRDVVQLGLYALRTASTIGSGPPAVTRWLVPEMHGVDDSALRNRHRRTALVAYFPTPWWLSTGTRFFWNICDPGILDLGQDPCPNAATLQRCAPRFTRSVSKRTKPKQMVLPVVGSHPGRRALC